MVPHITCECPPNYQGKFCEEKMENVIFLDYKMMYTYVVFLDLSRIRFDRMSMLFVFMNECILIYKVTRLCDEISHSSAIGLINCDSTKHECVTYSRTGKYVYGCKETDTSQDRQGNSRGSLNNIYRTCYVLH